LICAVHISEEKHTPLQAVVDVIHSFITFLDIYWLLLLRYTNDNHISGASYSEYDNAGSYAF